MGTERIHDEFPVDRLEWGNLTDWGQLVRLPNIFTLLSDCVAAAIVGVGSLLPLTALVPTFLASVLAYWAGMILNDVVDLEEDRESRPERPLAAGRISPVVAGHIATGMLMIGPIIILGVAAYHSSHQVWLGAAFVCSAVLSLAVRLYNSILKSTPLGPLLMGSCRSLNILMVGCSLAGVANVSVFPQTLLAFAAGIGLYILGVTIYAHREERESSQLGLTLGLMFELAGLTVIGCLPLWQAGREVVWYLGPNSYYPFLIALIGLTVLNRGAAGILHPVSRKVQLAVKHAILTLILIDAAVVLMWAGPWFGVAVVMLLFPALASAIRFRST